MFVGVLNSGATVATDEPYIWNQTMLTNSNISYNSSTGTITIKNPGYYNIHVDISGNGAGLIKPTLVINNSNSSVIGSATSAAATDVNIAFDSVIKVIPGPSGVYVNLSIVNRGAATETITGGNIVIERVA
nr:MAG TPA: C1q domain protein [Caudoviricetes sp.]